MSIDLIDGITQDTDLGYVDDQVEDSLDIGLITASVSRINDLGADLTVYYTQSPEPTLLDFIFLYSGAIFSKVSNYNSEYNYINTADIPGVNLYRVGYENLMWDTIQQRYIHGVLITVNTTPSYARVVFTVDGVDYAQKSIYVDRGTTVTYTVTAENYRTVINTIKCEQDQTINIEMNIDYYQPQENEVILNLTGAQKYVNDTKYSPGQYLIEVQAGSAGSDGSHIGSGGGKVIQTVGVNNSFIIRAYSGSKGNYTTTEGGINLYAGEFKVNGLSTNNTPPTVSHIFGNAGSVGTFGTDPVQASSGNCLGNGAADTAVLSSGAGSCLHLLPINGVFGTDYLFAFHCTGGSLLITDGNKFFPAGSGGAYGGGASGTSATLTTALTTSDGGSTPYGEGGAGVNNADGNDGTGIGHGKASGYGAAAWYNGTSWVESSLVGEDGSDGYIKITYIGPYTENDIMYSSNEAGDHIYTPDVSCKAKIVAIGGSGSGGDNKGTAQGGCGGKGDINSTVVDLVKNVPINIHVGAGGKLKADGGNGGYGGSGRDSGGAGGGAGDPTIVKDSDDNILVYANPGAGGGGAGGASGAAGGAGGGAGGGFKNMSYTEEVQIGENTRDIYLINEGIIDQTQFSLHEITESEYNTLTSDINSEFRCFHLPTGTTLTDFTQTKQYPDTSTATIQDTLSVTSIAGSSVTFSAKETFNGEQFWNISTLEIQDVVATEIIPAHYDITNIPGANGGNADSGNGFDGNISIFPDLHGGKADGGWNAGDPGHSAYGGGGNGGTGGGAGGGAGERNNQGFGGAGGGGAGGDEDAGGGSVGILTGAYHSFTNASNVKTVPTDTTLRNAEYGVSGNYGTGGLPNTEGNPGYVQITFISYNSD